MKKQLLVLGLALAVAFTLKAQNFSGHFIQESKEMVDGKEYLNAIAQEITITQTKDSIKIVRVTPAGEEKTSTSSETLPVNGKQVIITTSSKRKRVSYISFDKDKGTATIISTYSYADKPEEIEFKNTEIWSLDPDGTLTITKTSDAAVTDDWTIKAVFKKN
jgi:hypothetical protein